jgi:hypothetical protein
MTKSRKMQRGGKCDTSCDEYQVCGKNDDEIMTVIKNTKKILAAHKADPEGTKNREANIADFEKRIKDLTCLMQAARGVVDGGKKRSKKSSSRRKRKTSKKSWFY